LLFYKNKKIGYFFRLNFINKKKYSKVLYNYYIMAPANPYNIRDTVKICSYGHCDPNGAIDANIRHGTYNIIDVDTGIPNDSMSAIEVPAFMKVRLGRDTWMRGEHAYIDGPRWIPVFDNFYDTGIWWENKVSSMDVDFQPPSDDFVHGCCWGDIQRSCDVFQPDSDKCHSIKKNFCNNKNNMHLEKCKQWCKVRDDGMCDAAVKDYCKDINPDDPFCDCINSEFEPIKVSANPKCLDKKCVANGYQPLGMKEGTCPDMVTCTVQAVIENVGGIMLDTDLNIEQNCGFVEGEDGKKTKFKEQIKEGADDSNADVNSDVKNTSKSGNPEKVQFVQEYKMFIIIFIVIMIALSLAIVIYIIS